MFGNCCLCLGLRFSLINLFILIIIIASVQNSLKRKIATLHSHVAVYNNLFCDFSCSFAAIWAKADYFENPRPRVSHSLKHICCYYWYKTISVLLSLQYSVVLSCHMLLSSDGPMTIDLFVLSPVAVKTNELAPLYKSIFAKLCPFMLSFRRSVLLNKRTRRKMFWVFWMLQFILFLIVCGTLDYRSIWWLNLWIPLHSNQYPEFLPVSQEVNGVL